METKLQLKHPAGKKAVRMDKGKYDALKTALMSFLKAKGESSHTEIMRTIAEDFKHTKTKFEGSVEWHLEWVKLDLEARKEIERIGNKSPARFAIAK